MNCDDGNICTRDVCIPEENGCTYESVILPCDDGNPCTVNDLCNDSNVLQVRQKIVTMEIHALRNFATLSARTCSYSYNDTSCSDGNVCTTEDQCTNGACVGQDFVCDDGNVCTVDGCDVVAGCGYVDDSASCDDGVACTNDSCDAA